MKKVALITGSSQGIGAAIAKLFASSGYAVVVTYKSQKEAAEKVVKSITDKGGEAIALQLDVTSEESVKKCFAIVEKTYNHLDVLVNNAAVDHLTPIETASFETWKNVVRTKLDGNFLCTKYALPLLKKPGKADLIVIMSNLGDKPDISDVAYSVATAGTVCFIKTMALDLAKYGIRTNGVGPSETKTNLDYYKEAGLTSDESWIEMAKNNPLGRVTTVDDVAQTILTVVENPTGFWNGNFIYVTGGSHLK